MTSASESAKLDALPRFDARDFQPPAWASGPQFRWGDGEAKNGESSKSARLDVNGDDESSSEASEGDDEKWEDAEEDLDLDANLGVDPVTLEFTTPELRKLLGKATELKNEGNRLFTARPPKLDDAVEAYKTALQLLPPCPRGGNEPSSESKQTHASGGATSGLEEVTDEEARRIAEEEKRKEALSPEEEEREEVEEEVRECTKACWGHLGACCIALKDDNEAVKACSEALKVDPHYVKALSRRAAANDRTSSWTSLEAAQKDYTLLLDLLPASSPQRLSAKRALDSLPPRMKTQQEKETAEMLGKLKELGNGLLGKFGLSTDMFKFDQQPGGGYNMRFER